MWGWAQTISDTPRLERFLTGIDLTDRAVAMTRRRFEILGLENDVRVGNAEQLVFTDDSFDIVYSWGVIHHSPDKSHAVDEIFRVLKPGGCARIMIFHMYSLVGFMLWLRYALLAGRPFTSLRTIYARWLESPGTKAYTRQEARALFRKFRNLSIDIQVGHADLLASQAGQRHGGILLDDRAAHLAAVVLQALLPWQWPHDDDSRYEARMTIAPVRSILVMM